MIKTFKHKGLEKLFYTGSKRGVKPDHVDKIERILDRLHAACNIKDMNYPGSGLHKLTGDKKGTIPPALFYKWGKPRSLYNGLVCKMAT